MTALIMFMLLALLYIFAESRPFNPILQNTQNAETTTPALYWDSILPNTPMPIGVKNLLKPDFVEEDYTTCDPASKIPFFFPPIYRSSDEKILFSDELLSNLLGNLFFLVKDMRPGKLMKLKFPKSCNNVPFIPREVANSIPFSSDKLSEINDKLSIKPGSTIEEMMKHTIKVCEMSQIEGEKKQCATSLESMIDFSTSMLEKNVEVISTELDTETPSHNYTIISDIYKLKGDEFVVCHKLNYAYAVFYCHYLASTTAYMVSMVGADGNVANVAAMCHADTSAWDPNHMAFKVLKIKPGTVPVCHFVTPGNIVWTNN